MMDLRARSGSVSYSDDRSILGRAASECNFADYSLDSKPLAHSVFECKWKEDDIDNFRIKVIDLQDMFPTYIDLPSEAQSPVIPEWKNGNWLFIVDVKSLPFGNKVKTLIVKLRKYIWHYKVELILQKTMLMVSWTAWRMRTG